MKTAALRGRSVSRLGGKVSSGTSNFIKSTIPGIEESDFYWLNTINMEDIDSLSSQYVGLGNLHRINDVPRINKFFEEVNRNLDKGQFFITCLETKETRKSRIMNNVPRIISGPYYALDFIFKRVLPKWKVTKKLYFWVTKGRNRVISLAEGLGRLSSCGFEILDYQRVGYLTYVISQKTSEPAYDMEPTYGALVRLKRVGENSEFFDVYKFRTMHPYSEYLQDFVYKRNSLQDGGKIKEDFRITGWGKIFRKLWIDEFPMFINLFKGQMKLVGVRPLSRHYFGLYPEFLQELRTKIKPGLVPPFYADMPVTLDEIIDSEYRYLKAYMENPIRTDIKYFFKAFYNIIFKKARSS